MTFRKQNIQKIKKLRDLGVDTGDAETIIKSTTNRNFTLDSELTACEILMKSYSPKENKFRMLFKENEIRENDIKINETIVEVKRVVIPKVQRIVDEMIRFYAEILLKPNRFIQAIIAKDEATGLDVYKELKIHKTEGISGTEILIELNRFNDLVAKKILNVYKKNKDIKIPIIDVRYFPIPDYNYIQQKIHNSYPNKEYFLLLLTYDGENMDEPYFFPIYYPKEKFLSLIEELSNSISYNPAVQKYACYLSGNEMIRDENGFRIIKGKKICKSLTYGKKLMVYGVSSKSKKVTKLLYNKKGERKEVDIEYLKLPRNKNKRISRMPPNFIPVWHG